MNINSTFLIQIINFFVVYYMLKELLFFPVLKYINNEQQKTKEFTNAIADIFALIVVHEKNRQDQLVALKKYFLFTQPLMLPVKTKVFYLEYDITEPSRQDIEEFSKKLEVLLRKKLHVDMVLK